MKGKLHRQVDIEYIVEIIITVFKQQADETPEMIFDEDIFREELENELLKSDSFLLEDLIDRVYKRAHDLIIEKTIANLSDKGLIDICIGEGGRFQMNLTEEGIKKIENI